MATTDNERRRTIPVRWLSGDGTATHRTLEIIKWVKRGRCIAYDAINGDIVYCAVQADTGLLVPLRTMDGTIPA